MKLKSLILASGIAQIHSKPTSDQKAELSNARFINGKSWNNGKYDLKATNAIDNIKNPDDTHIAMSGSIAESKFLVDIISPGGAAMVNQIKIYPRMASGWHTWQKTEVCVLDPATQECQSCTPDKTYSYYYVYLNKANGLTYTCNHKGETVSVDNPTSRVMIGEIEAYTTETDNTVSALLPASENARLTNARFQDGQHWNGNGVNMKEEYAIDGIKFPNDSKTAMAKNLYNSALMVDLAGNLSGKIEQVRVYVRQRAGWHIWQTATVHVKNDAGEMNKCVADKTYSYAYVYMHRKEALVFNCGFVGKTVVVDNPSTRIAVGEIEVDLGSL